MKNKDTIKKLEEWIKDFEDTHKGKPKNNWIWGTYYLAKDILNDLTIKK